MLPFFRVAMYMREHAVERSYPSIGQVNQIGEARALAALSYPWPCYCINVHIGSV